MRLHHGYLLRVSEQWEPELGLEDVRRPGNARKYLKGNCSVRAERSTVRHEPVLPFLALHG
jgi:hypothetical protein